MSGLNFLKMFGISSKGGFRCIASINVVGDGSESMVEATSGEKLVDELGRWPSPMKGGGERKSVVLEEALAKTTGESDLYSDAGEPKLMMLSESLVNTTGERELYPFVEETGDPKSIV